MSHWPALSNWISRKGFDALQRINLHVSPVHYYSAIPDTREIPEAFWDEMSEMVGVDMNEAGQLALLDRFVDLYRSDYDRFPRERINGVDHGYYVNNRWFETVDGECLYCVMRYFKPRRVIEIGSGFSTYLIAQAVRENREAGHDCVLTTIDPHPNPVLRNGFDGLSELRAEKVQAVELSLFSELEENDILFIDSSHVLHLASDVRYELLEVVPRLKPGVAIHFHDIFLPAHYPRRWIEQNRFFWTEQYALQAFLSFNDAFEVLWAGAWMHCNHPGKLESAFPSYDRATSWPGSFWIRRKG